MSAAKKQPDKLVRQTTKRDGLGDNEKPKIIVAEGTPLARLQAVHEDPESGVLVGDLNDVLSQCDQKDEVVVRLAKIASKQKKADTVPVAADEVEYLTAMLLQAG